MLNTLGDLIQARGALDSSYRPAPVRNAVACAVLAILPSGSQTSRRVAGYAAAHRRVAWYQRRLPPCLPRRLHFLSRDIFERFWKDRLHESVDDRQTVAAWQRLLASAVERAPAMKPSPLLINAIPMHPDGLTRRQVIAGLIETRSAAALQRRAPELRRADASELIRLVDRVERRLRPWWQAEGERSATARIQGVTETAHRRYL